MQLWMQMEHFPYIVIWGTFGLTGGLAAQALDLDNLLTQALPAVMERTIQKGGLCAFTIGVDPKDQPAISAKLAELQPMPGDGAAVH